MEPRQRPHWSRVAPYAAPYAAVWAGGAALCWTAVSRSQCTGMCAVSQALSVYVVLAACVALSVLFAVLEIVFLSWNQVRHANAAH